MTILSLSHLHAELMRASMEDVRDFDKRTTPLLVMSKKTMRALIKSLQPFLVKPVVGETLRDELMGCQVVYDKHTPTGEVEFYTKLK